MNWFIHTRFLSTACLLLLVGCGTTSQRTGSEPEIAVTVPYGSYDSLRPFPPLTRHGINFYVLLTNVSDKPVRLWQEWCSWGYYCLQFEVFEENGAKHLLKKKPRDFLGNFPDSVELRTGESVVWAVDLLPSEWEDLSWLPKDGVEHVQMRAIYTVKEDEDSKDYGVWTGQAVSEPYHFILSYFARNAPATSEDN